MTSRFTSRLGLQTPSFTYPDGADIFETTVSQARAAEAAGFDSFWVMDHFYQLPGIGTPDEPMLEAYTVLAGIAARTSTIQLGAMVGGVTYRNPAFLAKTVTTLDIVSGGRAIWGIGAGWFEMEHDGYGYDFGTFTDRFEKLEEALQIVKSMFVEKETTFDGKWFQTRAALNSPRPIRVGGPPIMIGGSGPKKTLRMVAQYGDACNVFGGAADVRRLMGVLDEHCEELGRDPSEIWRTKLGTIVLAPTVEAAQAGVAQAFGASSYSDIPDDTRARVEAMMMMGPADKIGEEMGAYKDAGLDGIVINMPGRYQDEDVHQAAEIGLAVFGR
jgi:F420-dependent oxidoreductase-like protein